MIEMMIAMSIFVTFLGILFNSYTSIVRSQREANDYREMYVEARQVFDYLTQELRNGMVDYAKTQGVVADNPEELSLISKDGLYRTTVSLEDGIVKVEKIGAIIEELELNQDVKVTDLDFYITPLVDPYNRDYFAYDSSQFHPKVTIFASFEKELDGAKEPITMELQTTISSRIYNQVYAN